MIFRYFSTLFRNLQKRLRHIRDHLTIVKHVQEIGIFIRRSLKDIYTAIVVLCQSVVSRLSFLGRDKINTK